jgi:hypothetical protein
MPTECRSTDLLEIVGLACVWKLLEFLHIYIYRKQMQEQISEKEEEIKLIEAKSAALEKEIQWKKQVRN